MKKKLFGLTASIATLLGILALGAVEMARGGEMLLKVWGVISFVLIDIYVIINILKEPLELNTARSLLSFINI